MEALLYITTYDKGSIHQKGTEILNFNDSNVIDARYIIKLELRGNAGALQRELGQE